MGKKIEFNFRREAGSIWLSKSEDGIFSGENIPKDNAVKLMESAGLSVDHLMDIISLARKLYCLMQSDPATYDEKKVKSIRHDLKSMNLFELSQAYENYVFTTDATGDFSYHFAVAEEFIKRGLIKL